MVKKEDGNGINYALYLIAILLTVIIFYYAVFSQKMVVVKEHIINGMQICENHVLTSKEYDVWNEETGEELQIERELDRLHIVTEYNAEDAILTLEEAAQVKGLAKLYIERITDWFHLEHGIPSQDVLSGMTTDSFLVNNLTIYEAVYDSNDVIQNFIIYSVSFHQNVYASCTKQIVEANEVSCVGSTLSSTISCKLQGPNSILKTMFPYVYTIQETVMVDVVMQDKDDRIE